MLGDHHTTLHINNMRFKVSQSPHHELVLLRHNQWPIVQAKISTSNQKYPTFPADNCLKTIVTPHVQAQLGIRQNFLAN